MPRASLFPPQLHFTRFSHSLISQLCVLKGFISSKCRLGLRLLLYCLPCLPGLFLGSDPGYQLKP